MSGQWHYTEGGAQYGPVDEAEIIRLIQEGELPIGTPVLQEGHTDWQPARDHACFQVEIYPKKKAPVQAAVSTASIPASGGASQSPSQTTAQPAAPASPAVATVIVKEKSVLPWAVAGVACVALGLNYWVGLPDKDSDERAEASTPPAPTIVTNVVTNVLKQVVTNIVTAPQPTPVPTPPTVKPRPTPTPVPVKPRPQPTPTNIVPAGLQNAIVEKAIRRVLKKPEGELTKADLEKVTSGLIFGPTQITDAGLKDVAKLEQLKGLHLAGTKITDAGLKDVAKLQQLEGLDLSNTQITDAGLKDVAKLLKMTRLVLNLTQITDVGLKEVAKLQQLRGLSLERTKVTDAGLKELAKLQQLESLNLYRTQITDAGLKELAKLQKLETLVFAIGIVGDTKVTKAGVAQLQKALPKCKIYGP